LREPAPSLPDTSATAPALMLPGQGRPLRIVRQADRLYHPSAVSRRRLAVPVLLALSGLGWAAAHAVTHKAVMTDGGMPEPILDRYLSYLTTSVALCLALALPLAACAAVGKRWKGTSLRSLWLFGLIPVLGFIGHTATEQFSHGAPGGVGSLLPLALVGLVQIPFALVAVGFARHLLWLAERLARVEIAPARAVVPAPVAIFPRPHASRTPVFRLDLAHTERGPPLLAA
jgi:hypothetical protein